MASVKNFFFYKNGYKQTQPAYLSFAVGRAIVTRQIPVSVTNYENGHRAFVL